MNCFLPILFSLSFLQMPVGVPGTAKAFTQDDGDTWIGKPLMPKIGAQVESSGMERIPLDEIDYPMFATESKGQYLSLRYPGSPVVLISKTIPFENAEEYYLNLINDREGATQARIFLAVLELGRKNYLETLRYAELALSSDRRNKFALFLRAKALYLADLSECEEALKGLEHCLEIDSNYANAIGLKAQILSRIGEDSEAMALYSQAVRLKPNVGKYYALRGVGYFQSGEHEMATKELLRAIELEPLNPRFPAELAWVYFASGTAYRNTDEPVTDFDKSFQFAAKACELSNWKNAELIRLLKTIAEKLGKEPECQKLEQILRKLDE